MAYGMSYLPPLWKFLINGEAEYRHTSVVVFGKEFFYGMGIYTVLPGASHVSPHSPHDAP
jgi:hypothetical protein